VVVFARFIFSALIFLWRSALQNSQRRVRQFAARKVCIRAGFDRGRGPENLKRGNPTAPKEARHRVRSGVATDFKNKKQNRILQSLQQFFGFKDLLEE